VLLFYLRDPQLLIALGAPYLPNATDCLPGSLLGGVAAYQAVTRDHGIQLIATRSGDWSEDG